MTARRDLPNFAQELKELLAYENKMPPVEDWHPERSGEVEITIKRDGQWLYQGDPMTREATVQLFSRIMRKEQEDYFLVTPAEKMRIHVELFPFVVRLMDVESSSEPREQRILLSTNVGDTFELNEQHPIRLTQFDGDWLPVVRVRHGLEALVSRQVYYEMAELAQSSPTEPDVLGIWSCGHFFPLVEE